MARAAFKLRAELCERSFALVLDRGGMRPAWLRGRENLHKRYLLHVAGYDLGLLMRLMTGVDTPRGAANRLCAVLFLSTRADCPIVAIAANADSQVVAAIIVDIGPLAG